MRITAFGSAEPPAATLLYIATSSTRRVPTNPVSHLLILLPNHCTLVLGLGASAKYLIPEKVFHAQIKDVAQLACLQTEEERQR